MKSFNLSQKLTAGIIILIVLSICLCITTFALTYSIITVENNMFKTGYVSINLNNKKPVIEESEFIFEPGMTVQKDFFIENTGSCSVFYKLYFTNVDGKLAEAVTITISKDGMPLYSGTVRQINRDIHAARDANGVNDILDVGERRNLTVTFRFPSYLTGEFMEQNLSFDLNAEAVQVKNNPNALFD